MSEPSTKPTNPKDAVGVKKVPLSTVSCPVIMEMALSMQEGALKYGKHNWRAIGVRSSIYYDAAMRHLMAWWEGEDVDPDSGLSHVTKAMACLHVLRDSMIQGNLNDDRPPKSPAGWVQQANSLTASLLEKYPSPPAPFLQSSIDEQPK